MGATFLRHFRYFYFRLYKWMQEQQPEEFDNHFTAGYLFSILIYFPLLLLDIIGKVFFDSNILLSGTEKEITLKLLLLATVLFAITYEMFISRERRQKILKEFSRLDGENRARADRAYKIFICISVAALLLGMTIATLRGLRAI